LSILSYVHITKTKRFSAVNIIDYTAQSENVKLVYVQLTFSNHEI